MINIDVAFLDVNQVLDHLVSWLEVLHQQSHHLIVYFLSKALEPNELWHLNLDDNSSEFLKHQLNALKTG